MLNTVQDWSYLTVLLLFLATGISWLLFGRLTMARIERDIKADGLPRPSPWDGPGARILSYAYALALPEKWALRTVDTRLLDAELIRRYAIPADRIRGAALLIFGNAFVVFILLGSFVFDVF